MFDRHEMFSDFKRLGLIYRKILVAGIPCDRSVVFHGGTVVFFHNGTAHATSDARRHFDEAVVHVAAFDIFQTFFAVFHAVDRHISVLVVLKRHRFKYAAGCREKSCAAFVEVVHIRFRRDSCVFQPFRKFLKSQDGVNVPFVKVRLVLF